MKAKIWLLLIVCAVAAAGGATAYWLSLNHQALVLPGIVEIQEVRLGSKVGGRVEKVLVNEGDIVYKNTLLVVFEAPELRNQKQQLEARLASARAELNRIKGGAPHDLEAAKAAAEAARARFERVDFGWRPEEKKQAASEFDSARADYEQAQKEWVRVSGLFREKSASRTEFEAALAYRDRASGRKDAAEAKVKMLEAGSRKEDKAEAYAEWQRMKAQHEQLQQTKPEDIKVAEAKLAELQAQVEAVDIQLAETIVSVPSHLGKAVIEVIAVRPGDLIAPNQPVVRVLRADDLWVKIFVPETQYGLVTLDKKVQVTIDSHAGKVFTGTVRQRSNIAEFTPRNVQSVDERHLQVFAVKVRVDDPQGILNAGMAAAVEIPLK